MKKSIINTPQRDQMFIVCYFHTSNNAKSFCDSSLVGYGVIIMDISHMALDSRTARELWNTWNVRLKQYASAIRDHYGY